MTNPLESEFTPLREAAISMHELYQSFIDAGFTAAQAFSLVGTALAESMRETNRHESE